MTGDYTLQDMGINLVEDCRTWASALPPGDVRNAVVDALQGCTSCRVQEATRNHTTIGYAMYSFDVLGAHLHHVYVTPVERRKGLATRLFRAFLVDMDRAWCEGQSATVSTFPKTEDGRALAKHLGFALTSEEVYEYVHNGSPSGA